MNGDCISVDREMQHNWWGGGVGRGEQMDSLSHGYAHIIISTNLSIPSHRVSKTSSIED